MPASARWAKRTGTRTSFFFGIAVAATLLLRYLFPWFGFVVLLIGGFFSLALLFRLLDSLGKGVKFLKKHIQTENVFSKLRLTLPDRRTIETFHFNIRDSYPTIGGGGKEYADFRDDQYCLFTDEEINEVNYAKLKSGEIKNVGNMSFEFFE